MEGCSAHQLQWGRGLNRGGTATSAINANSSPGTSMGPRSEPRRNKFRKTSETVRPRLQWGRGLNRGGTAVCSCASTCSAWTSMGPRSEPRRNPSVTIGGVERWYTSMGPRSEPRRNYLAGSQRHLLAVTSMGPRSEPRRNTRLDMPVSSRPLLQWGRGLNRGGTWLTRWQRMSSAGLQWGRGLNRGGTSILSAMTSGGGLGLQWGRGLNRGGTGHAHGNRTLVNTSMGPRSEPRRNDWATSQS